MCAIGSLCAIISSACFRMQGVVPICRNTYQVGVDPLGKILTGGINLIGSIIPRGRNVTVTRGWTCFLVTVSEHLLGLAFRFPCDFPRD
jgi:hypothetical protein